MKNLSRDTSPIEIEEDKLLDLSLRPKNWDEFVGQDKVKKNLKIILTFSLMIRCFKNYISFIIRLMIKKLKEPKMIKAKSLID